MAQDGNSSRLTVTFYSKSMVGDDACLASEALFAQKHTYIDFISSAPTYRFGADRLEIITAQGEVLDFRLQF